MWLCPEMKMFGLFTSNLNFIPGAYLPGYPPICVMITFTPSVSHCLIVPNLRRVLESSILPATAISGANADSLSITSLEPMSPACQISSHSAKYFSNRVSQ